MTKSKALVYFYLNLLVLHRRWLGVVVTLFVVASLSGFVTAQIFPEVARNFINAYSASLDKNLTPGLGETFYIFQRNLTIVTIGTFGGFLFGMVPLLIVYFNGYILGLILGFAPLYSLFSPLQLFLLLAPHGIFEYFATFLGLAAGLRLGLNWLFHGQGKRQATFLKNLVQTGQLFILVIVVLFVAALIEGNLTKLIACTLGKLCK